MFGLIKDLAGMLNQSSLNTLTLSGSSYMDLPVELRSPRKGLINIKNKDQKCFYGVMLGILILQKNIQKELKKPTKNC